MTVNIDRLFLIIQGITGYDKSALLKKNRSRKVLYPRQVICYILKIYYSMTFEAIGKIFNQDHTSVLHSVNTIQTMIDINDELICSMIDKVNHELSVTGHFKGSQRVVMYVPIQTNFETLKQLLIEKYGCSFNIV